MTMHSFREKAPEPPTDAIERWSHGILGALLGIGAAILFWLLRDLRREWIIAVFVAFPILGAIAAMKWGERFWNWVLDYRRNWA